MTRTVAEAFHQGGEGSPLVLLHGLTMSWRSWRPVLGMLEEHHSVFAPTLPGHRGAAPQPPDGHPATVLSLTDAVERQLDEAGLGTVHVAGNSLGGWLALELSRRGRARSVVAFSPAGAWRVPSDLWRLHLVLRAGSRTIGNPVVRLYSRQPQLRRLLLLALLDRGDRIPPGEVEEMFRDIRDCTVLADLIAAGRRDGQLVPLDSAPCPLRIAWGKRDRTIPFRRYGDPLAARVPGAELVMLPGVGHMPMYDNPRLVARTILEVTGPVDHPTAEAR